MANFDPISSQPQSPLIDLVNEIWREILKKLTQAEALKLRFVNRDFKTKIDSLYDDWKIRLRDHCPYLDMILDLRVKEVTIERFVNQAPNRPLGTVFKYPDLITKLFVPNSDISSQNLHFLLQLKNLKSLEIGLKIPAIHGAFWETMDPKIGYKFLELDTLAIKIAPDSYKLVDVREGNLYEIIMTQSKMPKLRSAKINWTGIEKASEASVHRLSTTISLFLNRHGKTLKHLNYQSCNSYANEIELLSTDLNHLKNCSTLETLDICQSSRDTRDTWKDFVQNQLKVSQLVILASWSISQTMCVEICDNNFKTLTKVIINDVKSHGVRLFDISIFCKCLNLKHLSLSGSDGGVELSNLCTLPEQIEILIIEGFNILTENLSRFLNHYHCILLLNVNNIGNVGAYGVNLSVIKQILNHGSLSAATIGGQSCLNVPSIPSELAELNNMFLSLGFVFFKWETLSDFGCLNMKKKNNSNGTATWLSSDY